MNEYTVKIRVSAPKSSRAQWQAIVSGVINGEWVSTIDYGQSGDEAVKRAAGKFKARLPEGKQHIVAEIDAHLRGKG